MIGYTREEVRDQFGNRAINFVYTEDLIVATTRSSTAATPDGSASFSCPPEGR